MNREDIHMLRSRSLAGWSAGCLGALALGIASPALAYDILHDFGPQLDGGIWPRSTLVEIAGAFYGTTWLGGVPCQDDQSNARCGVVFRINGDGTGYQVIHAFTGEELGEPAWPLAGLILGRDGALYGTTSGALDESTSAHNGMVFKLNPDGSGFTVLHIFSREVDGSRRAKAPVLEASDDMLYGTTVEPGGVYRLNKDGSGFETIHVFSVADSGPGSPNAAVIEGSDGRLYGTTPKVVYSLNKDGSDYTVLHREGSYGPVIEGSDHVLYGTNYAGGSAGFGRVFALTMDGTGFTEVHAFDALAEGRVPYAGLIEGRDDGVLYGNTRTGGDRQCNAGSNGGCGVIFRLNKDGSDYTVLHVFSDRPLPPDGTFPERELVESDGFLYGTVPYGGANAAGIVFRQPKRN